MLKFLNFGLLNNFRMKFMQQERKSKEEKKTTPLAPRLRRDIGNLVQALP